MTGRATAKPVPIDLTRHTELIAGAREFLRVWASEDGPVTCFVNPVSIGPDPAAFGLAMVDCIRHAAAAYARAVDIPEKAALARIWQGLDAERAAPTTDAVEATPPVAAKRGDPIVSLVPKQDPRR
ncbi:DUF5076 domain-containing protein [Sphingomonas bacterium]|uniref:DUF5076 domain-containing protein n=1 Tax=Sphingomonas bacterium TaxID=1895847 RepID=UPI0020C5D3C1|nr:DUF5076 domain-containing protein [Sphingomonas bacterium]